MSAQAEDAERPPDASVIVVTHNNASLIQDCLSSIDAAVRVNSHEIIVVDNGSTDTTRAIANEHPSRPRVVALNDNLGFAAANNAGIRASLGRLIVLVNSDAFPDRGSIDRLITAVDELPNAGIVGGRLRYPNGELQPSVGRFPSLLGGVWVALFLHRAPLTGRLDVGVSAHPALYRVRRRVDWVTAAFCISRRETGLIPTQGFMYGEDVMWALQAREAGREVWLDPAATALHVGRASVDQSQDQGFAQRQRVEFELEWFGRKGRASRLAARGVLALHAVLRIGVFGGLAVARRRPDGRVAEFAALFKSALSPGRRDA